MRSPCLPKASSIVSLQAPRASPAHLQAQVPRTRTPPRLELSGQALVSCTHAVELESSGRLASCQSTWIAFEARVGTRTAPSPWSCWAIRKWRCGCRTPQSRSSSQRYAIIALCLQPFLLDRSYACQSVIPLPRTGGFVAASARHPC